MALQLITRFSFKISHARRELCYPIKQELLTCACQLEKIYDIGEHEQPLSQQSFFDLQRCSCNRNAKF